MSGALLDTSILIANEADSAKAAALLPASAAISVVTLGELHAGVRLAKDPSVVGVRQQRLTQVRAAFRALPVDEPIAERYGDVLALARSQKRMAKATDLLIIATALATGRDLVTLDRAQRRLAAEAGVVVPGD
jgi:predicted nucleic acid-binding protein